MTRFPEVINEVAVDIYCDSTTDPGVKWRDIAASVMRDGQVVIAHGSADEDSSASPARCALVLKDLDGDYSPRNPLSPFYGFLGRNTPLRVRTGLDRDLFGATVVNGWGTTTSGRTWTLDGTAADFDKTGSAGTVNIPAATNIRIAYLADSVHANVDVEITFSLPAATITGGSVLAGGLIFRGVSLTDFLYARVSVLTDNTMTLSIVDDGNNIVAPLVTVPNVTYAQNVQYTVRALASEQSVYARVWRTDQGEPIDWHTSAIMTSTPKYKGWVGLRTALGTGSTNGPLVITYTNYRVRSPRFQGEISAYRPSRDTTGNASFVTIGAGGTLRRLSQGQDPVQSALRRSIPLEADVVAYWPMEEGSEATRFESAIPGGTPLEVQSAEPPRFAANSDFDASAPIPVLDNAIVGGMIPTYDATINTKTQFRFLLKIPDAGTTLNAVIARIWGTGTARLWQILYDTAGSGTLYLEAYNRSVATLPLVGASLGAAVNGKLLWTSLELEQNGANVDWALRVYEQNATGVASVTGTLNSRTILQATYIDFDPFENAGDTAIGHVSVQSDTTPIGNFLDKINAWAGETAGARIARLCSENGVADVRVGDDTDTAAMGPQRIDEVLDLLREAADTDMGSLYDSRAVATADGPSLEYRTRTAVYDQDAVLTLDMSLGQVAPPWEPVDDDQLIRNDVTAQRVDGSESRATLETGPLSVLPVVEGGVGRYRTSYRVNPETDYQLQDIAGWRLALGTVDEYRYPTLSVDLANPNVVAAELQAAVLDVGIGDRVTITNAQTSRIYDDIDQVVRGYQETLSSTEHTFAFNCSPYEPYRITVLDDAASAGYLDAETATLHEAVDSDDTVLRVVSETESFTSTVPFPIMVGGERMTVTAVANPAFRSVGTATHADNASVAPGLPAGHAERDLLVVLAAIRNSGTGTVNTPTGYTLLADGSNVRLFGKVDNGAEAAPTVAFTGGAAGATCSVQMAAFQRVALTAPVDDAVALNGASQDMAILQSTTRSGPLQAVVAFGWKQDDWTSVTALTGATEIAEFFSTLGSDQGLTWNYQMCDGLTTAPWGESFVVTGGTSQISRTGAVTLRGVQELTVTRAVNGVVKSHAVGAEIHVAQPARLAL